MIKKLLSIMLFLAVVGMANAQAPVRRDINKPQHLTVLKSGYDAISGMQSPDAIKEWESMDSQKIKADNNLSVNLPAYSMAVIRLGK